MRGQRSTNPDRFLFLWDGVIQNDIWAQVAWLERQFPISAIDRIEVMYGPASLLYGSNAISGIISITTKAQAPESFKKYSTNPSRPVPSPNLKPERLRNLEVGWDRALLPRWRLSVNQFLSLVDQQIIIVPTAGQAGANHFENRGRLRIWGAEMEARYLLDASNSLYLNLTTNRARDLEQHRDPGGIAPMQAQFGADLLFFQHLSVSVKGRWISARFTAQHDSASLITVHSVAPYATVDLALGWREALPGLEVRFDIQNLSNTRYYDPGVRSADGAYYNGAILQQPYRAFAGVAYRF